MTKLKKKVVWVVVFFITTVMGVPWFLWGSSLLFIGIPLWVWYHVGWLLFAVFLFWLFVKTYWTKERSDR